MNLFFNPKAIIAIIISLFGLYWSFMDLNFGELFKSIMEIDYYYLILASLFLWLSVFLRGLRWKYLFKKENLPKINFLYKAELIGCFGNNILPMRLGELLRSYIVGKECGLSKSYVFGTVLLERILDTFILILLSVLMLFFYPIDIFVKENILIGSFWISIFLVILIIIANYIKKLKNKNKFVKIIKDLFDGFLSINKNSIFPIVILNVMIWGIYLLNVYFLQCAFDLDLTFVQILIILVISSAAMAIPSAPGMIGTYHAAVKYTLVNLFGYSSLIGNSFAIVMHAYGYILLTILGSYYFFKSQISFNRIQKIPIK